MDENDHCHSMAESAGETSFKKRHRKKHIYRQLLDQMEFYFSDANLARDRFLAQLLEQSSNIPLEVFLRFNKVRAITGSIEEIAKALGSSELLKVTEDGKHVYRTKPVQEKNNRDDCMIYVEQLPADANHDWVIGIFSAYGKVEYVSIPKYKNRAAIKGFAFVEFDTPDAAKKALEAFGSAGCCLPPQMPPEELCSVTSFHQEETQLEGTEAEYEAKAAEKKSNKHKKKGENSSEDTVGKMHGTDLEEREWEEPKSKKLKTEYNEPHVGEKRKKKDKTDNEDNEQWTPEEFGAESEAVESIKTKKGKKRKFENEDTENLNERASCDVDEEPDDNSHVKGKRKKKHLREEETTVDEREGLQMEETKTIEAQSAVKTKGKKKRQQLDVDDMENGDNEVEEEEEAAAVLSHDAEETKKKKKKKKKHTEVESENDAEREDEEIDDDDEGTTKRAKKQNNVENKDDGDENEEAEEESEGDMEKSNKKKKRKRSKNKKKKKNIEKKENDPASLGLRIISRKEWSRLRNKYLNLQREKMHSLKKHLARAKFGSNYQSPYPTKDNVQREEKQDKKSKSDKKCQFVPGTIILIDLDEPLGELEEFKRNAQSHPGVAYVDANDGDSEVYIRCYTTEVAQGLVGEKQWGNMKILEGEAESKYWEKIQEDRKNKIENKTVGRNLRGRNKLLKRAERELGKHIKFDD